MSEKVRLVDTHGATSVRMDVGMTDEGDLLFSEQDVGDAPNEFWGDSDYEYWLKVSAADKDRVLLALIEKLYSGNSSLVSEIKGIPSEFASYV